MGFIRKITGVQAQIDSANRNADIQEQGIRESAAAQQRELQQSAKAAADQQSMLAARNAAEAKAADAAALPLGVAEVQLAKDTGQSATAARRTRRAKYGTGYSTGVSI